MLKIQRISFSKRVMKKFIKCFGYGIISVVLVFMYSINAYATSNAQKKEFMYNHSEILKSIKECSECVSKKGDIRIDFLEEIIHFNDIQICMAENIIKCGDDKDTRNLAKTLIKNSMECTTELNEILDKVNKEPVIDKENEERYINEYINLYNKMILDLECNREDGSIEETFINASIKHHESLIEVTNIFCKYSNDKKINESAKDIKDRNSKEIKKLKNSLKKCS